MNKTFNSKKSRLQIWWSGYLNVNILTLEAAPRVLTRFRNLELEWYVPRTVTDHMQCTSAAILNWSGTFHPRVQITCIILEWYVPLIVLDHMQQSCTRESGMNVSPTCPDHTQMQKS